MAKMIEMYEIELGSTRYRGYRDDKTVIARSLSEASAKAVKLARKDAHDRTIYASSGRLLGSALR